MGPVCIAVILAFTLLPGLILLWLGLAAQKRNGPADNNSRRISALPTGGAAVAPATPAAALTATVAAGTVGKLVLVQGASGKNNNKMADQPPVLQLQIPSSAPEARSLGAKVAGCHDSLTTVIKVDCGRAPVRELVGSWLAPLQQQPAEDKKLLRFEVFAMGPKRLVADVQLLCDDFNSRIGKKCGMTRGRASDRGYCHSVMMHFVRKTHQF